MHVGGFSDEPTALLPQLVNRFAASHALGAKPADQPAERLPATNPEDLPDNPPQSADIRGERHGAGLAGLPGGWDALVAKGKRPLKQTSGGQVILHETVALLGGLIKRTLSSRLAEEASECQTSGGMGEGEQEQE
jgi:hypothetical protein